MPSFSKTEARRGSWMTKSPNVVVASMVMAPVYGGEALPVTSPKVTEGPIMTAGAGAIVPLV